MSITKTNKNKKLFSYFCRNGFINDHNKNILFNPLNDGNKLLYYFCKHGLLNEIQILVNIVRDEIIINSNVFTHACLNNHLEVAKFLFHVNPSVVKLLSGGYYLFRELCTAGKLEMAKWLLSVCPTINISDNEEVIFLNACESGKLELAKWLLSVCPTINISIRDEFAFRYACVYNHLHVAKWLLSVKPTIDVTALNDFAFCFTALEIATWLASIKPWKYKVEIQTCNSSITNSTLNTYTKRILSKKEQQYYFQRYPLWLMSSISPNQNSIFYKLPLDISKEILLRWL